MGRRESTVDLNGCELRVELTGFRVLVVSLDGREGSSYVDVGTILLKSYATADAGSISVTTLQAPEKARKRYDRALKQLRGRNARPDKAAEELQAALAEYPAFAAAWTLLGEFVRTTPPNLRAYHTLYGQMLVAMALVRAGLPDSARSVALRSRGDPGVDPTHDLAYYEALVRAQLGDKDEAFKLLGTYLAANPQMRQGMVRDETWLLRDLRSDPRFATVVGTKQ